MAVTQFDTPTELFGVIFVVIAIILFFLLGIYLLFSYRRNKAAQTLYISLILLFGSVALLSLVLEQLVLIASDAETLTIPPKQSILDYSASEIDVFWVAYIGACGAYLMSALAVLSGAFFTHSFFPKTSKKILIIPALMLALYVIILVVSPFEWTSIDGDWQPKHDTALDPIIYLLMFPPLWSVVILFYYLAINLYRRGAIRWRQALILGIGQTLISIAYTVEIVNIADPTITMISRFAIMLYPVVMYFGFIPPGWFKGIIGLK